MFDIIYFLIFLGTATCALLLAVYLSLNHKIRVLADELDALRSSHNSLSDDYLNLWKSHHSLVDMKNNIRQDLNKLLFNKRKEKS